MERFRELVRQGNWRYGIATRTVGGRDGAWSWQALRVHLSGSPEVIGTGQAESQEEAERLAAMLLQAEWETLTRALN